MFTPVRDPPWHADLRLILYIIFTLIPAFGSIRCGYEDPQALATLEDVER